MLKVRALAGGLLVVVSGIVFLARRRAASLSGSGFPAKLSLKPRLSLRRSPILIVASFAVVGAAILAFSHAATPGASLQADNGYQSGALSTISSSTASGGSAVKFGGTGVRRFFADDASWNQPVSAFGYATPGSKLSSYADKFFKCAGMPAIYTATDNYDCLDPAYVTKHSNFLASALAVSFVDYSTPMYNYDTHSTYTGPDAIGTTLNNPCGGGAEVYQAVYAQRFYIIDTTHSIDYGDCMPWSYDWRTGTGTDSMMSVMNYKTGEYWSYAGVLTPFQFNNGADLDAIARDNAQCNDNGIGPNTKIQHGINGETRFPFYGHIYGYYDYRTQLCGYGFAHYPFTDTTVTPHVKYGNLYTAGDKAGDDANPLGHGIGIPTQALVTRAAEVQSGEIRHALELSIASTMFADDENCATPGTTGTCTTHFCNPVTSPDAPGAGDTCAIMLPPAAYVEFASGTNTRQNFDATKGETRYTATNWLRQRTVPEGMRIALDPSFNIDAWVNSSAHNSWTAEKKNTCKIFATALRDYGAVIAETAGAGVTMMTDGLLDTTPGGSRDIWHILGIDNTGGGYPNADLLQGLLTSTNIKIVNPPPRDPKLSTYP